MQHAVSQPTWLGNLIRSEVFPGILLVAATAVALIAANSPFAAAWNHLFETEVSLHLGSVTLQKHLSHWINDGLMVLFFFFVGLEIKHEVLDGQLQSLRAASLPVAAALGGMLAPAGIYAVTAWLRGDPSAAAGWGIPMATDIAFALGVLALLGSRIPPGLKVFLSTLAIVDDLGAVLVIAIFYTDSIAWPALAGGIGLLGLSYALNRCGVRRTWPYALLGIAIWLLFLKSGVHATIAGVALAITVPARRQLDEQVFSTKARALLDEFDRTADPTPRTNEAQLHTVHALAEHCHNVQAPLQRMEHALEPWVAFAIVPLFALANAGVDLGGGLGAAFGHAAGLGVYLGLLLGKPIGVYLATKVTARLLQAQLPAGVSWRQLHGAAWLAGIGFTMSLFVNELAFGKDPASYQAAKVAVLCASALAAVVGGALLLRAPKPAAG